MSCCSSRLWQDNTGAAVPAGQRDPGRAWVSVQCCVHSATAHLHHQRRAAGGRRASRGTGEKCGLPNQA